MEQARDEFPPTFTAEIDRLGLEFLAGILEVERSRHPANIEALAELGHVYTRLGWFERGLDVDRDLVQRCPRNPTVHYNLACSLALLGQRPEALASLELAVELGYDELEQMLADADLASLKKEHRFRELVKKLEEAALDR